MALGANFLGAVASIAISFLLIPLILPIIMTFKTAEMVLVILMALLFISVLTKHNRIKGLIAAGIGLLLSCIGFQPSTGVARLTFGNLYLYEGLEIPTVLIGIMAMPVLIELHATHSTIAPPSMTEAGNLRELLGGMKELLKSYKSIWLRGTLVGYLFGLLPAIGGTAAVWMVYAHAKQTSRHPEEFGKGTPEGIVGPEAAANAAHPGDLLITLALGIPGSGIMVVLLAAFLMMGVTPGPKLLIEQTTLCFAMILAVATCSSCHQSPYLGGQLYQKFGVFHPYEQYTKSAQVDEGHAAVTKNPADKFFFKVPVLRNVAETPPYFHDGSVDKLEDAVVIMAKVQLAKDLTKDQVADITAFLKSLTGKIPEMALTVPVLPSAQ